MSFETEESNMDTDSIKKDTMDVNCLSSGNTLLIKIDNVNVIQHQFDRFLEKFASHEKVYHDEKLPQFVINSFSKLFKHWLEFPDLQKLIGRDILEEIFDEMANVFEPKKLVSSSTQISQTSHVDDLLKEENSPSDLEVTRPPTRNSDCPPNLKSESPSSVEKRSSGRRNPPSALSYFQLFCNDCNDNVEIVNGDPRLSYNLHVKSEDHLRRFDPPKAGPQISPSNVDETEKAASSTVIDNTSSNVDAELLNSDGSSSSDDSESVKAVTQYKLPTLFEPFCEPCCKNIQVRELFIGKHLESKKHKNRVLLYEKSKKILEKYGYYFSFTNRDTFDFRCHICMKRQTGTNNFIQHCKGHQHRTNLREIEAAKL